jgi:UDP-N-acetylmuramyl pentapeptide phosphotransferase/UDP-N-acetylglucosamine-1-phosphate transferase
MSLLASLNLAAQALALGWAFASLGLIFCRNQRILPDAMGGRMRPRPAGVGVMLYVAFLAPLLWHVGLETTTRADAFYSPEVQKRIVGAMTIGSLALMAWGWRLDRTRAKTLKTLWVMWGAQAAVWVAGIRVESIAPGLPFIGKMDPIVLPAWASLFATLLWLSTVASVIELLHGVDGLGASATGAGSLAIFLWAWWASPGDLFVQAMACLLAASSLWAARVGRPGAKSLPGKNGALLLGFWFACLTVLARQKGAAAGALTPFLAAALLLAVWLMNFAERSLEFRAGRSGNAGRPSIP